MNRSLAHVQSQIAKIRNELDHKYTDQDVDRIVNLKQGFDISTLTDHTTAIALLNKQLEVARAAGEYDTMEKVQKTIERIEHEGKLQQKRYQEMTHSSTVLAQRNKARNRRQVENSLQFKKEEDKLLEQQGLSNLASHNPYLRRETQPTNIWIIGKELEDSLMKVQNGESVSSNASSSSSAKPISSSASKPAENPIKSRSEYLLDIIKASKNGKKTVEKSIVIGGQVKALEDVSSSALFLCIYPSFYLSVYLFVFVFIYVFT